MRPVPSKLHTPNSKLRIIVTGTRGFPNVQGGVEAHCEHLYPFLAQNGCDVTILTRAPYVDPAVHSYKGVKLIPISCPKSKFLEAIIHTFKGVLKAKTLGCDVLHIHAIGPALMVPFARMLGMKVAMTNHGPDYNRQKWGRTAKSFLWLGEYLGSKWADKVISISKPIADSLRMKYKRDSVVIPNGVGVPQTRETDHVLKEFGLEKGKYVLTIGRFVPEKGFHDLMDSWELGVRSPELKQLQTPNSKLQTDWKLVIVGDADHADEYSRKLRAKSNGLANVILTGRLTGQPLQELYSHAGLFVLPSYHEGLPIVLLEAMSYGLSCIVSDIPANREVDLEDDRYFKPGGIEGMAAKIRGYIDRPLSQEEKHHQTEYIRENFNWEKIAGRTLEVYKKVGSKT